MSDPFSRPTTVYLGGTRAITKTKYGTNIFFDTRDLSVGIPLALDGDYEPELNPWMIATLRPGDIAVEVGANIGFYALSFAGRVGPGGHVHAFEANPELIALLRDSIDLNYIQDRCTIHPTAVSDVIGDVEFSQPAKHLGSGSLLPGGMPNETWRTISVPSTTLDAVFTGREPPIRLLHIDTEASEPQVIAGGRAFIERQRDMIIVLEVLGQHFRARRDQSLAQALRFVEETGRVLCLIQDNKPMRISAEAAMQLPAANVAAIPRHLAEG